MEHSAKGEGYGGKPGYGKVALVGARAELVAVGLVESALVVEVVEVSWRLVVEVEDKMTVFVRERMCRHGLVS